MSTSIALHAGSLERDETASTREPAWVKVVLISVALSFFAVFLLLPLVTVFAEGLRKGWGAYLAALTSRDAWDAITSESGWIDALTPTQFTDHMRLISAAVLRKPAVISP